MKLMLVFLDLLHQSLKIPDNLDISQLFLDEELFSGPHSTNTGDRHAERQAVNSICQGSASDLVKLNPRKMESIDFLHKIPK